MIELSNDFQVMGQALVEEQYMVLHEEFHITVKKDYKDDLIVVEIYDEGDPESSLADKSDHEEGCKHVEKWLEVERDCISFVHFKFEREYPWSLIEFKSSCDINGLMMPLRDG